jgi:hypothetical protein
MNEPKESVEVVSPAQGRANTWWRVRPMLGIVLLAEILAGVVLFVTDATSAALIRSWFRPIAITMDDVQTVVTVLAIVSVVAVLIAAARKGRSSSRRNAEGLKVASAPSVY